MASPKTLNDEIAALSDRELIERLAKQADHLDSMLHEVLQFIDQHRPLLERWAPLADPGAVVRALRPRKHKEARRGNAS